jgi:predicted RNase H-like nuclease
MPGCLANPDLAGRCREFHPKVGIFLVDPEQQQQQKVLTAILAQQNNQS